MRLANVSRNEKRKKKLRERAALERQREDLERLGSLCRDAVLAERYSEARTIAQEILNRDPQDHRASRAMVALSLMERDYETAASTLESLPWRKDPFIAMSLAEVSANLGRFDRSVEICRHILSAEIPVESRVSRARVQSFLRRLIGADRGRRGPAQGLPEVVRIVPPRSGSRIPRAQNIPASRSIVKEPASASGSVPPVLRLDAAPAAPPATAGTAQPRVERPAIRVEIEWEPPRLDDALPSSRESRRWARLRREFHSIDLLKGYDELLCLESLRGVDRYWFQVETAKRVLRQFHGRVLLADEVGLGKTIEAAMVVKEYLLRGVARRVLILTPPNLVEQWREELSTKFALDFAEASASRLDPAFWREAPLIISSINMAKSEKVAELVLAAEYDLVVVDEAHHLRNRSTRNWELVNALRRRFLILISATPVQNHLVELFNLLTLLRPGLFRTEQEFKRKYLSPKNPRLPRNRDELRELMSEVMIRNTRSLVDVKLPRRHAATIVVEPSAEESEFYRRLTDLLRENPCGAITRAEAARLLAPAGSSPWAAEEPLLALRERIGAPVEAAIESLRAVRSSAKVEKTVELLRARPGKKIVFAHSLKTLDLLARRLEEAGLSPVVFHGGLSRFEKDEAVRRFREEADIFLSSESGGEGRNLQFCAAMINFDLPWNPMRIEQRIGRIHRIGQEQEVFIFNLSTRGTVEEKVLQLLHEKINMFELVVGEIDGILGHFPEERDFAEVILDLWLHPGGADEADKAFSALGESLVKARDEYAETTRLDRELFGEDFQV